MKNSYFKQYSETAPLKQVILGRYKGYASNEKYIEIVNEDQKQGLPSVEELAPEFEQCRSILEERGVDVLIPEEV